MIRLLKIVPILMVFVSLTVFGESSKFQKIDLDVENTHIVRAELGQMGWFYWIDVNACICWVGSKNASEPYATAGTFDCKRLKAHPKLAELLSGCAKDDTAAAPAPPAK